MRPRSDTADELKTLVRALRTEFSAAAGFSFFINLLTLVPSLYMLQVYDRVLNSRNLDTLLMLTLIATLSYVVLALLDWVRSQLLVQAGLRLDAQLGPRAFDASFAAARVDQRASVAQAFGDAGAVRQLLTGPATVALMDLPWLPLFLVAVFLIHPLLGWIGLGSALLLLAVAWANERLTRRATEAATALHQQASAGVAAGFRNHEAIAAMGMLGALRQRWRERQQEAIDLQGQATARALALGSLSRFLRMVQQMLILGVGALLAVRGEISPGAMIASSILLGRALAPIDMAIASWRQVVLARDAWGRLRLLLQRHAPEPAPMPLPAPTGEVSVEQLTVVPPNAQTPALADLSFQIRRGMAIGVIGPSASGKSTLARALTGVWAPARGAVRLDGASLADWDSERLGPHIGYLPQSVELLEGTIAENICRFGTPDAERIVAAARLAGIHDLVLRLPQAYDTPIGIDGAMLSGGQRQRVALARAVYGDPCLVVLDEPNANLDEPGEAALVEAIAALKQRGATVVLITHRRSTLAVTDGVLVLKGGRLQVYGPTAQVLKDLAGSGQVAGAGAAPTAPQAGALT